MLAMTPAVSWFAAQVQVPIQVTAEALQICGNVDIKPAFQHFDTEPDCHQALQGRVEGVRSALHGTPRSNPLGHCRSAST